MTQEHPITPSPELIQQWWAEETYDPFGVAVSVLATYAAQWGADQELEACEKWIEGNAPGFFKAHERLRAARRPKPPSLKEQALLALEGLGHMDQFPCEHNYNTIRRALEQLPR